MAQTIASQFLSKYYRPAVTALAVGALCSAIGPACKAIGQETPDSTITVYADRPGGMIGPRMFGSCIEDVNHEIYGGLYDQKLFGESFEEPASTRILGWTQYEGSWNCNNGVCTAASSPGAKLVRDDADSSNCSVETDVRFQDSSGDNAGLLVHVRNAENGADNFDGYEVSLSPLHQQVILGKHVHDWRPLQSAPVQVKPGIWMHLCVQLIGARVLVYVGNNAAPAIDYIDSNNPLLSGSVALRTWNSNAAFRNVSIKTSVGSLDLPLSTSANGSVSGAWDSISTGNASAYFLQDSDRPYNGKFSQMIDHGSGSGRAGIANSGLHRWGISTVIGHTLQGHLYLRCANLHSLVTVAMQSADGVRTYASTKIGPVTNNWTRYDFTLKPTASDPHSRFAIWIDGPGKVWVDQTVLMDSPADRFHGLPVRGDIAKAIVDGGITFMRYGGTMVNAPEYRWKKMIGDPDRRPPYDGHWYPYSSNGFGIFDFLNFCEAAHIRSAFAINCEETDQDAADLADYLTGSLGTKWGRKRAADGHPAPYHVDFIEIGNEEVIWRDNPKDYVHYAERFTAIARAIHGRNPNLKLVCAAWWVPQSPSMELVFDAVNGQAAAWDLHVWSDDARAGKTVSGQIGQMQSMFKQWDPHTNLKAVIFEENGNLHNMQRALGHATTLNAAIERGDFVIADCPANCLQPDGHNDNGWDQGQIFFTPDKVWMQPPYYVQQMVSGSGIRTDSEVSSPAGDLSCLARINSDGKDLTLEVVNCGSRTHVASLDLKSFNLDPLVKRQTLAGEPDDTNTQNAPLRIVPVMSTANVMGSMLVQSFPAYSVSVLRFTIKP